MAAKSASVADHSLTEPSIKFGGTLRHTMSPVNRAFASGTKIVRSPPVWPRTVLTTTFLEPSHTVRSLSVTRSGSGSASIRALSSGRDPVAEQVDVVGPHPSAHVPVGNDDGARVAQHLVTPGVVDVVVRVDDIADRLGSQPPDLADKGAGGVEVEKGVDHQHAVIADDEAGV